MVLATSIYANSTTVAPVQSFDAEFDRMNDYFNTIIESHLNKSAISNIGYPRTNIKDLADKYIYEFDLAGIDKKDIKLTIDDNNILTLEGQKQESSNEKSDRYVTQEIFYGSFKKMIKLPENIEADKLSTNYNNGILTLTIPKKELKKPKAKVIPIQ
jgi:HSP20 family protein